MVLSSITAIFGQTSVKSPADDEKLMELYWNRNELKKEFADLRNEKLQLKDRLKIQKGDYARLEQKIRHLEELLTDPEWSHNIMVHYQLRGLNEQCVAKLARFAEQIKQQREQKKHGKALAQWRASMDADVKAVEQEIAELQESIRQIEHRVKELLQRFMLMNGIVRFFKRRSMNKQVSAANEAIAELQIKIQERQAGIEEIQKREPPENVGLTLMEKRTINHMIIAYGQELFAQFCDDELVSLIKEASDKSAGGVQYGSGQDCAEILERLRLGAQRLQSTGDITEVLKKRAKLVSEGAQYHNDEHAVPLPATVAVLFRFDQNGNVRTSDLDLLGSNYWNVAGAMSR